MAPQAQRIEHPSEEDHQDHYNALKTGVVQKLKDACLSNWGSVSEHFRRDISSPRTLSSLQQSRDLNALLTVLEHRDCLGPDNVDVLSRFALVMKCTGVIPIVDQYKKLVGISSNAASDACNICGSCSTVSQENTPIIERPILTESIRQQQEEEALDRAVATIIPGLSADEDESWIRLARALHFVEGEIDNYEVDILEGAEKEYVLRDMFKTWRERQKREGYKVNVNKLKKALIKARRIDLFNLLT